MFPVGERKDKSKKKKNEITIEPRENKKVNLTKNNLQFYYHVPFST